MDRNSSTTRRHGLRYGINIALFLLCVLCVFYLWTNWNEKATEIVVIAVVLSAIVAAFQQAAVDPRGSSTERAFRLATGLLLTSALAYFMLAKMPLSREAEWVGATLYSEQKSGPYLYKGFVLPEDFYRRNWKFGILLNGYYDKHKSEPLPRDFFVSWITRAVMMVLTHEMHSHWLVKHQRAPGFGETWGPATRAVKSDKVLWSSLKPFESAAFSDVKVPVVEDGISLPPGGSVRYSREADGRIAHIQIRGKYAHIDLEIEFLGAPGNFTPYPEWTANMDWAKKSNLRPVLYAVRGKSHYTKWHWDITSEQLSLESRWVDDVFKLLQHRFDDKDYLDRLSGAIQRRAALKNLLGRIPKHLENAEVLDDRTF